MSKSATMLCHARTQRLFAEADAWIRSREASRPSSNARYWEHANESAIPSQIRCLAEAEMIGGPKVLTTGATVVSHRRSLSPCKTHDP